MQNRASSLLHALTNPLSRRLQAASGAPMTGLLLAMTALLSQASDQQLPLLKTFREEFVAITPGKAGFPASFMMGSDQGESAERPAHRVTFAYTFHVARY